MKTDIIMPQYQITSCWYELFLKDDTTVGIRLHRAALDELDHIPWTTAPVISDLILKYRDLVSFTPPSKGKWGFNDIFIPNESSDSDWIVWEFKLPNLKFEYENWKDNMIPKIHISTRASLYIFFFLCRYLNCIGNIDSPLNQLMVFGDMSLPKHDRFASGSLDVILTPATLPWIFKQSEKHVKEIQDAMRIAHEFMWKDSSGSERFGARISHPKWIYLDVPGDACNLGPDNNGNTNPDLGYRLVSHNVDSGLQQLTFIVGLAKLHDLMRADGY